MTDPTSPPGSLDEQDTRPEEQKEGGRGNPRPAPYHTRSQESTALGDDASVVRGTPASPNGRYKTIVADPPWAPISNGKANPRRHYAVMTTDDICALSPPVNDAQHLWLWGINAMMEDAFRVVRAWGFSPISIVTWCKPQPGVGVYVRNNTEHVILAKRGANCAPVKAAEKTWYLWPRAEHSRKPDAFYDLVETVSPGPYLEMFARRQRLGWDTWGNEALEHVQLGAA